MSPCLGVVLHRVCCTRSGAERRGRERECVCVGGWMDDVHMGMSEMEQVMWNDMI